MVICRCEEVAVRSIRRAIAEHPHLGTLDAVKLVTRAGMGPCQGRMCQFALAHVVAALSGRSAAELGPFRARTPIKPILLRDLATSAEEQAADGVGLA